MMATRSSYLFRRVAPDFTCPKCGRGFIDNDGFGFLACRGRWGCGYCTHPSATGGRCDICKAKGE